MPEEIKVNSLHVTEFKWMKLFDVSFFFFYLWYIYLIEALVFWE